MKLIKVLFGKHTKLHKKKNSNLILNCRALLNTLTEKKKLEKE